jgi:hypothetical protein
MDRPGFIFVAGKGLPEILSRRVRLMMAASAWTPLLLKDQYDSTALLTGGRPETMSSGGIDGEAVGPKLGLVLDEIERLALRLQETYYKQMEVQS